MSESVNRLVGDRVGIDQGHHGLVAAQVLGRILLVAHIIELVVAHLLVVNLYRRVVDAIIYGIVFYYGFVHIVAGQ